MFDKERRSTETSLYCVLCYLFADEECTMLRCIELAVAFVLLAAEADASARTRWVGEPAAYDTSLELAPYWWVGGGIWKSQLRRRMHFSPRVPRQRPACGMGLRINES